MKSVYIYNKNNVSKTLKLICLMIPFFMPGCLLYISIGRLSNFSLLFNFLKIVSILFFLLMTKGKMELEENSVRNVVAIISLYGFWVSMSCFVHTANPIEFSTFFSFTGFAVMCMYFLKKNASLFLSALVSLFGAYNLMQLTTVVFYYPNGITNYEGYFWEKTLAEAKYFFGGKNQAIFYMLIFMTCIILKNKLSNNIFPKRVFVYFLIFFTEAYVLSSLNSQLCLLMFGILITIALLGRRQIKNLVFRPYVYFAITFVVFIIICILGQAANISVVSAFLGFLGKNATFTNRIYIWEYALILFVKNPIWGAGEIPFIIIGSEIKQAHNVYLDVMYKYGSFAIVTYLAMMINMAKHLNKYRSCHVGAVCISLFFVTILHNCFDTMDNYLLILLFCIFSNIKYWENELTAIKCNI